MPRRNEIAVHLPSDLKAAVKAEAGKRDQSMAAYVREAIVFRLGWDMALEALKAGVPVEDLSSDDVARHLLGLLPPLMNDESPRD